MEASWAYLEGDLALCVVERKDLEQCTGCRRVKGVVVLEHDHDGRLHWRLHWRLHSNSNPSPNPIANVGTNISTSAIGLSAFARGCLGVFLGVPCR